MRQLYAIRDTEVNELTPQCFIANHDSHAIRMFQEMAGDERLPIARYLKDHELISLGEVNDAEGYIGKHADYEAPHQEWRVVLTGQTLIDMNTPAADEKPRLVKEG